MNYVVIIKNPSSGLFYYGPFNSYESGVEWATSHLLGHETFTIEPLNDIHG